MLPNYKSILITTDLTPNSELAFKHAVLLARQSEAKIHLIHVVPEIDAGFRSYVSSVMGEGKLEEFESQHASHARADIKQKLEEFAHKELTANPDDLKNIAEVEVVLGNPVTQILKAADRFNVDIIVMGTHGKGALEHTLLGSVAEKVLHKSKRPVFIVPLLD